MQTSFFAASFLLLLPFSFCFRSLHSPFILLSCIRSSFARFFRSLLSLAFLPPFFLLSHLLSVVVPCRTPPLFIRSSFFLSFPLPPYSYMGGYEAKVRKIDRKVTYFLWKYFIWQVYFSNWVESHRSTQRPSRALFLLVVSTSDFVYPFSSIFQNCDRVA